MQVGKNKEIRKKKAVLNMCWHFVIVWLMRRTFPLLHLDNRATLTSGKFLDT
jgi:hypothetical protein